MRADQIVLKAREMGFLPTSGHTPVHTMRARLSDEIRKNGSHSEFQRTGPNKFGLRTWGGFPEFYSRAFKKQVPDEITVCVPAEVHAWFAPNVIGYTPISDDFLGFLSDPQNLTFVPRRLAETDAKYRQLVAYVWLEEPGGTVLCYTRGKYSSAHPTLLLGKKSVGFGGHVLQTDAENLFARGDAGLHQAAFREVAEELKDFRLDSIDIVGTIWDNTSYDGQRHIGIVLKGRLTSNRKPGSGELSINQLELLTKQELWGVYHNLEFWSQLTVREFAAGFETRSRAKIVPGRRPPRVDHIALVGEIASGKSTIANMLTDKMALPVVSASRHVGKLLGFDLTNEGKRAEFQHRALAFIEDPSGPANLAASIAREIEEQPQRVHIIDGLRQLSTLEHLKEALPGLIVIYVDCPRDLACRNYQARPGNPSVFDFASAREHPVESDIPNFRYHSDAVLHNADQLDDAINLLLEWLR